jgi:formylglycine-generating enzyme required for sulfatase activity
MAHRICIVLVVFIVLVATLLSGKAQLLPEVTPKPAKPPATKPAQIVVQTSPNAEVYFDDEHRGRASAQGRLVVTNPKPREHNVRVSLAGEKDFSQTVNVSSGQETRLEAGLLNLGPAAGEVRENPKDGLKYVWIPPGSFMMGCSPGDEECVGDEKPAHRVTIGKGFWIGQTEVTVAAYKRFVAATGRRMVGACDFNRGWANENMPIVAMTWNDAHDYCAWAGGRLPTEAEWEYAARGGSTEARYGNIGEIAWYGGNSGFGPKEVAQKRANSFGLFDVLGNVYEWVNDWYEGMYYQNSPSQDPPGPTGGTYRVRRGGSWAQASPMIRVSSRDRGKPVGVSCFVGLRCRREVFNP